MKGHVLHKLPKLNKILLGVFEGIDILYFKESSEESRFGGGDKG
jgi:hypothetical protein